MCNFVHDISPPCKNYLRGRCRRKFCMFTHPKDQDKETQGPYNSSSFHHRKQIHPGEMRETRRQNQPPANIYHNEEKREQEEPMQYQQTSSRPPNLQKERHFQQAPPQPPKYQQGNQEERVEQKKPEDGWTRDPYDPRVNKSNGFHLPYRYSEGYTQAKRNAGGRIRHH